MDRRATERMHALARAVRARALVRAWTFRQRHRAAGVWFRLRRALADAKAAYVISDEDASGLLAEGYVAVDAGLDVVPPKTMVFVPEHRLEQLASRRPIRVDLGPAFLAARAVALVRFEEADPRGWPGRPRAPQGLARAPVQT